MAVVVMIMTGWSDAACMLAASIKARRAAHGAHAVWAPMKAALALAKTARRPPVAIRAQG